MQDDALKNSFSPSSCHNRLPNQQAPNSRRRATDKLDKMTSHASAASAAGARPSRSVKKPALPALTLSASMTSIERWHCSVWVSIEFSEDLTTSALHRPVPVDPDRFTQRVVDVLFTAFADNVSLEIHLAQRMSNLTTVEFDPGVQVEEAAFYPDRFQSRARQSHPRAG